MPESSFEGSIHAHGVLDVAVGYDSLDTLVPYLRVVEHVSRELLSQTLSVFLCISVRIDLRACN